MGDDAEGCGRQQQTANLGPKGLFAGGGQFESLCELSIRLKNSQKEALLRCNRTPWRSKMPPIRLDRMAYCGSTVPYVCPHPSCTEISGESFAAPSGSASILNALPSSPMNKASAKVDLAVVVADATSSVGVLWPSKVRLLRRLPITWACWAR